MLAGSEASMVGKPYSLDLRKRVVAAVVTARLSCNRPAKQFGVAVSTTAGWVRRQRETGKPQTEGDFRRAPCLGRSPCCTVVFGLP